MGEAAERGLAILYYMWQCHNGECEACETLVGRYDAPPMPPHPNCVCEVEPCQPGDDAELIGHRTERSKVGQEAVYEATVAEGVSGTSGEGTEFGFNVGGERGVTIGFSGVRTETRGQEFIYREEVGGELQHVFAIYDVYAVREIDVVREGDRTYEVITGESEERELVRYEHSLDMDPFGPFVGAGEAETGDDDDDGGGDDGGWDDDLDGG